MVLVICVTKKYPLAHVCRLELSISPKHFKEAVEGKKEGTNKIWGK